MKILYSLIAAGSSVLLAASPAVAETVTFENLTPGVQTEGSLTYPNVRFSSTSGVFSTVAGSTGQALCAFQFDCSANLVIDFLKPASNVRFTYSNDDAASALSFQGEATNAAFTGRLIADGDPLTQDVFDLSIVPNVTQLIVFTSDPGGFIFDNFSFTTAAGAVPEPASWAMMIVGLGAVGGAMRRRNKLATSVKLA